MKNTVRKIVTIAASCVILGCLYLILREGPTLGLLLTITSQCLLVLAMFADEVVAKFRANH